MFRDVDIRYFDVPDPQNTESLIEAVKVRVKASGMEYVVVASESGKTAFKVAEALRSLRLRLFV